MIGYNLNHEVKFIPTAEGTKQFNEHFQQPHLAKLFTQDNIERMFNSKLKDGFFVCQFHELIEYFKGFPSMPFAEKCVVYFNEDLLIKP